MTFKSVKLRDFRIRGPTGPFIKDPEKFSHPESRRKISNLMILELFYSHILIRTNRGYLLSRGLIRTHLFCFR